jgi:cytoskeletal protein CcmA (bactofilin family)
MMEYVSSVITENIKNKNIVIESDGTLSGQLIYEEDE